MKRASPLELVQCPACSATAIGATDITCCDEPMTPVDPDAAVLAPTLDTLLKTVFGISEAELEVCLYVMEHGNTTVAELTERVDVDRSVVARHLSDLVEVGVVERERRLLRQGGHVYVYTPVSEAAVRSRLTASFAAWVADAAAELDSVSREKVEAITDHGDESQSIFR